MPSPAPRSIGDVDAAITVQTGYRRKVLAEIEAHLGHVARLRTQYAASGNRLNELLDERTILTRVLQSYGQPTPQDSTR